MSHRPLRPCVCLGSYVFGGLSSDRQYARRLPPTHQHSMIASKETEPVLPFRTTRSLRGARSHRPLAPLTPSPRNRFLVHYSEDTPTGAAAEDAAWRGVTSPRVLESIKQAEQFGQQHTSRVQRLQVWFRPPSPPPISSPTLVPVLLRAEGLFCRAVYTEVWMVFSFVYRRRWQTRTRCTDTRRASTPHHPGSVGASRTRCSTIRRCCSDAKQQRLYLRSTQGRRPNNNF